MNILDKLLTDGNTLVIDNSSLELFTKCPRLFQYRKGNQRRPREVRPALSFGGALHLALKLRYMSGAGPASSLVQMQQNAVLERYFDKRPVPLDEYRNLPFARRVIREYNEFYQQEPFTFFQVKGENVVETSFCEPIGTVEGINVMISGRLDGSIRQDHGVWPLDHKSTSMGGDMLAQEFYMSSQFKCYTWALRQILHNTGEKVLGTLANILICRKPAKVKGKGNEFTRVYLRYDDDVLDEWQENALNICADIIHCADRNHFPLHSSQCVGKYGRCEMFDVCTLAPLARESFLMGNAFEHDDWSPFREDEVDLNEILAMSEEELKMFDYDKPRTNEPTQQDILTNLLKLGD